MKAAVAVAVAAVAAVAVAAAAAAVAAVAAVAVVAAAVAAAAVAEAAVVAGVTKSSFGLLPLGGRFASEVCATGRGCQFSRKRFSNFESLQESVLLAAVSSGTRAWRRALAARLIAFRSFDSACHVGVSFD